jgi:ferredoxin-type protein NapG
MADKPRKPLDRRDFFRKLMLGALDKAESSSKAVGGKIAEAVRSAQAASDKQRAQDQAQAQKQKSQPQTQNPSQPPHPDSNDGLIIRRPENRVSRGSIDQTQDTPPADPPPAPPEEPPGGRSTRLLRPPGALPEPDFSNTCSRCGQCASVCPASCIMLDASDNGLPHIIARESACTACASVACTNACPTGALLPLNQITQINLGIAIVYHPTCLRTPTDTSPGQTTPGQDCRQCIAPCPVGETAIGIDPNTSRIQIRPGCIGCGLCEQSCPTDPTSIYIKPHS